MEKNVFFHISKELNGYAAVLKDKQFLVLYTKALSENIELFCSLN